MDGSRVFYTNLGGGGLENERVSETGTVAEGTFQSNSRKKNTAQPVLYLCIYFQSNVLMGNHESQQLNVQANRKVALVATQKVGRC